MSEGAAGAAAAALSGGEPGGASPPAQSPVAGAGPSPVGGQQGAAAAAAQASPFGELSEVHSTLAQTKGWDGIAAVFDSYTALESKLGVDVGNMIHKPTGPEDLSGISKFRESIGVPETHEGYDFTAEAVALGEQPNMLPVFQKVAHAMSANPEMAKAGIAVWNEAMGEMQAAENAEFAEQSQAEYKTVIAEWAAEGKATEYSNMFKRFCEAHGYDMGTLEYALGSGNAMRFGVAIARATGEAYMGDKGHSSGLIGGGNPAQKTIETKEADPVWMSKALTRGTPESKERVALYKQAHGTGEKITNMRPA